MGLNLNLDIFCYSFQNSADSEVVFVSVNEPASDVTDKDINDFVS